MANFRFSSKTTKQLGLAISVVVAPFLVYGLIWELPRYQASQMQSKEKFDVEQAARIGWVQGLGAIFAAGTAVTTWKTYQENQRNANRNFQALQEKQDRDAAHAEKNLQALLEKNTADRFSKAIEQLGNENSIHVRLGGIFALEQIANTEDKYYWQIMEILTAYVRVRSPGPQATSPYEYVYASSNDIPTLSVDIQAIMTVIGRRKRSYQNGEHFPLDLRSTDLRKLQLSPHAKLQGINFRYAFLQGADISEVNLEGANLGDTYLDHADLRSSNLSGAILRKAFLRTTSLEKSNLKGADLWKANLCNAYLEYAHLEEAKLVGSQLQDTSLDSALLQRANLQNAHLEGATLKSANLEETNFRSAYLINADLRDTNCFKAIFVRANLELAGFNQSILDYAEFGTPDFVPDDATNLQLRQISSAKSYNGIILPSYSENW